MEYADAGYSSEENYQLLKRIILKPSSNTIHLIKKKVEIETGFLARHIG
jgi:hypothetical protein